jgi:ribosomal protein S18 acetylase RimI-like enzyme
MALRQLIGFARAATAGAQRAYVEDVIVAPCRRGSGIGQAVIDRLIHELGAIPVVTPFCLPGLVRYYEASSFLATMQLVMHGSDVLVCRPDRTLTRHQRTPLAAGG